MVDAIATHGVAIHAHQEAGTGARHQNPIEIDHGLDIIVGGAGESRGNRLQRQGQEQGSLILGEWAQPNQVTS